MEAATVGMVRVVVREVVAMGVGAEAAVTGRVRTERAAAAAMAAVARVVEAMAVVGAGAATAVAGAAAVERESPKQRSQESPA